MLRPPHPTYLLIYSNKTKWLSLEPHIFRSAMPAFVLSIDAQALLKTTVVESL